MISLLAALGLLTSPCDGHAAVSEFTVSRGATLVETARCGALALSTDIRNTNFSWGAAEWSHAVGETFELRCRMRRLTPDGHLSLEIDVPGGAVLLRDDQVGFYESLSQWREAGGFSPIPGRAPLTELDVVLRQRGETIEVTIDGRHSFTYRWSSRPARGHVTFALKGPPGRRSSVLLQALSLTAPAAQPSQ